MGGFYTNLTLRGPARDAVQQYLDAQAITAYIAAPQANTVVVYDQASETQDDDVITARAMQLSAQFTCPVLAVLNHDDDVFCYWLYDQGALIDEYDSVPGYFTGEEDPPAGGDAALLCRIFGVEAAKTEQLETLLRAAFDDAETFLAALGRTPRPGSMFGDFIGAMERHRALVDVLGLPTCAVGFGFNYLDMGEIPNGLTEDDLTRCGPAGT